MRFQDEKKNAILLYLLKKIAEKSENPSGSVAKAYGINRNTVHTYINQLVEENVIKRVKRGVYALVDQTFFYHFSEGNGEIKNETHIFEEALKPHISEFAQNVREIWEYTFSEMVNNVIDHANASNLTIFVRKNAIKTTVCILDDGVGIFEKIKNHFGLSSLDEAICELFKGKLTTDRENHSGEGIFFSSRLMDEFAILSSDKIFAVDKFDTDILLEDTEHYERGTFVSMQLSNYSRKTSREVFDTYADADGGFTKTVLPLKNIFDTSPVSRSQAKRILLRLDKFKEIVLDFDGIDWMGQGFAHQIFVLFKGQRPDIQLLPVNMNEDVTKMYNHVINTNKA